MIRAATVLYELCISTLIHRLLLSSHTSSHETENRSESTIQFSLGFPICWPLSLLFILHVNEDARLHDSRASMYLH